MGMINELVQYHPLIADIDIARRQREELYVCKFLFGLSIPLQPLRGQFLTGENGIPTLQKVFSRISQAEANVIISTGSTKTLFSETSALHSFVDRAPLKVVVCHLVDAVAPVVVVLVVVSQCRTHYQWTNRTVDRCWELAS